MARVPMLALAAPPTAHRGEGAAPTGGGNTIILSTRCVRRRDITPAAIPRPDDAVWAAIGGRCRGLR